MKKNCFLLLLLVALVSCNTSPNVPEVKNHATLVQVSVIDALMQGFYDGFYSLGELKKQGDFGIGTFHALDGEMMLFNDTVFQIQASGEVKIPNDSMLTPFAAVSPLIVDKTLSLSAFSFEQLKLGFDSLFPTPNIFYLVKISGDFSYVRTRSVPAQERPYLPLVEVTVNQPEFEFWNVKGDIIGFYCPSYAQGINVVGLHLHFLNNIRTGGGHLIEFELNKGTLEIGYLLDYRLILPNGGDFYGGDFTVDRTNDIKDVEG
ncbi:MAG TPA: acetolactate decarboxylase [Prolixibacteraceae bacterium]|nr:acetolactate decarboxylase [Prolixibacteraceae bacterium]